MYSQPESQRQPSAPRADFSTDLSPEVTPRGPFARRPWELPRVTSYGSLRWLIRGASGGFGDKGTGLARRLMT